MGSGIAEVCARAGLDVLVSDVDDTAIEAGQARIERSLHKAVDRNKLSPDDRDAALGCLRFTTKVDEHADRQLVIEAVAENPEIKTQIFRDLDAVVTDEDAVLASNTSSIPIAQIATATRRPHQVMGIHFFNPVPVQKLVELVPSLLTAQATEERARVFAEQHLGKQTIRAQDRAGFVVNALLVPYLLSAIRMVEAGIASPEDVDNGMVLGCAHPMGPLRLADMVGLDTLQAIADSMYGEYKEPTHAPPPLLRRMVDAGLLGTKTGQGFYQYSGR